VPEDDARRAEALASGGVHEGPPAQPQEFGAEVVGDADPVEEPVAEQQQAEAASQHRPHQDHHVQEGQGAPDFDGALEGDVHPSAEVALHRAHDAAQQDRPGHQQEAEGKRGAHAVEDPGEHVAPDGVHAHPVAGHGTVRPGDLRAPPRHVRDAAVPLDRLAREGVPCGHPFGQREKRGPRLAGQAFRGAPRNEVERVPPAARELEGGGGRRRRVDGAQRDAHGGRGGRPRREGGEGGEGGEAGGAVGHAGGDGGGGFVGEAQAYRFVEVGRREPAVPEDDAGGEGAVVARFEGREILGAGDRAVGGEVEAARGDAGAHREAHKTVGFEGVGVDHGVRTGAERREEDAVSGVGTEGVGAGERQVVGAGARGVARHLLARVGTKGRPEGLPAVAEVEGAVVAEQSCAQAQQVEEGEEPQRDAGTTVRAKPGEAFAG
jgi:hypothetical protein